MPERPGNRIADSLGNIIEQEKLGLMVVTPGAGRALSMNAHAMLIADPALLRESKKCSLSK